MARDYSDFDARPEPVLAPEVDGAAAAMMASEAIVIGIQTALDRFMKETLPHLSRSQQEILAQRLPSDLFTSDGEQVYDANFSVADELSLQIQAVQALRQHVFPGGRLKHGASIREAKEVVTTCNQMIKTLMDSHERIMNMERMRAIEAATVDVLGEMNEKAKEMFLQRLELKLAEIS